MKRKQRHLTAEELNQQMRINALVHEAYARERMATPLDAQVRAAIRATHLACLTMQTIVLIDHYKVEDKEFIKDMLKLQKELLVQYGDGVVDLKQMVEHIKIRTGVDMEKFTDSIMEYAKIDRKDIDGSAENDSSVCGDSGCD